MFATGNSVSGAEAIPALADSAVIGSPEDSHVTESCENAFLELRRRVIPQRVRAGIKLFVIFWVAFSASVVTLVSVAFAIVYFGMLKTRVALDWVTKHIADILGASNGYSGNFKNKGIMGDMTIKIAQNFFNKAIDQNDARIIKIQLVCIGVTACSLFLALFCYIALSSLRGYRRSIVKALNRTGDNYINTISEDNRGNGSEVKRSASCEMRAGIQYKVLVFFAPSQHIWAVLVKMGVLTDSPENTSVQEGLPSSIPSNIGASAQDPDISKIELGSAGKTQKLDKAKLDELKRQCFLCISESLGQILPSGFEVLNAYMIGASSSYYRDFYVSKKAKYVVGGGILAAILVCSLTIGIVATCFLPQDISELLDLIPMQEKGLRKSALMVLCEHFIANDLRVNELISTLRTRMTQFALVCLCVSSLAIIGLIIFSWFYSKKGIELDFDVIRQGLEFGIQGAQNGAFECSGENAIHLISPPEDKSEEISDNALPVIPNPRVKESTFANESGAIGIFRRNSQFVIKDSNVCSNEGIEMGNSVNAFNPTQIGVIVSSRNIIPIYPEGIEH